MSFFDLDPSQREALLEHASQNPMEIGDLDPGMFQGALMSPLAGLASGAIAKPNLIVGSAAARALGPFAHALDANLGTSLEGWMQDVTRKGRDIAADLQPNPQTVGLVGQLMHGLTDVIGSAAVGTVAGGGTPGAIAAVSTFQGYAEKVRLERLGVDPTTAGTAGLVQAGTMGAGITLPMSLGARLVTNAAFGAGSNVALGMVSRGATSAALREGGYPAMAQQFEPFDKQAMAIDAILGAAFGSYATHAEARAAQRKVLPSDIDVALAANAIEHIEIDTAPGLPGTPEARDAHVQAMYRAMDQLVKGDGVDVANIVRGAPDMVVDPGQTRAREDIIGAVADYARNLGIDDAIANLRRLEGEATARGIALDPDAIPHMPPPRESQVRNPIDVNATPVEKARALAGLTEENRPLVQKFMRSIDEEFGTQSKDNVKTEANILAKAARPSILEAKPYFGVEHIRDSYRFKTVVDDATQIPDIVQRAQDAGFTVMKADTAKLFEPKEWGFRIAAFDLKAPNGQLVEWYLPVREIEAVKKQGHELFEKWRGENAFALSDERRAQMLADQEQSRLGYGRAWNAYLERTGQTDSALRASLNNLLASGSGTGVKSASMSPTVRPVLEASRAETQRPPSLSAANSADSTATRPSSARDTLGRNEATFPTTDILSRPHPSDPIEALFADREKYANGPPPMSERTRQALAENPDMEVPNADGSAFMRADEAIAEAERQMQEAKDIAPLHEIAVGCFLRSA